MLQTYLVLLGPYALLAAGCIASLCTFVSLKRDTQRLRSRLFRQEASSNVALHDLKLKLEDMTVRLRDAEERAGVLVAPQPAKSGLNLSKRSQVIRMSRQGQHPDSIAASLGLPRNEVELLIKVQGLTLPHAAGSTA